MHKILVENFSIFLCGAEALKAPKRQTKTNEKKKDTSVVTNPSMGRICKTTSVSNFLKAKI